MTSNIVDAAISALRKSDLTEALNFLIEKSNERFSLYNGGIVSLKADRKLNEPGCNVGLYAVAFGKFSEDSINIRPIVSKRQGSKQFNKSTFQQLKDGDIIVFEVWLGYTGTPYRSAQKLLAFYDFSVDDGLTKLDDQHIELAWILKTKSMELDIQHIRLDIWTDFIDEQYLRNLFYDKGFTKCVSAPTTKNLQDENLQKFIEKFTSICNVARGWPTSIHCKWMHDNIEEILQLLPKKQYDKCLHDAGRDAMRFPVKVLYCFIPEYFVPGEKQVPTATAVHLAVSIGRRIFNFQVWREYTPSGKKKYVSSVTYNWSDDHEKTIQEIIAKSQQDEANVPLDDHHQEFSELDKAVMRETIAEATDTLVNILNEPDEESEQKKLPAISSSELLDQHLSGDYQNPKCGTPLADLLPVSWKK